MKSHLSRDITQIFLVTGVLVTAMLVLYYWDLQTPFIENTSHQLYNWILRR